MAAEFTMVKDPMGDGYSVYWTGGDKDEIKGACFVIAHMWKTFVKKGGIIGVSSTAPVKVGLIRVGRTAISIFCIENKIKDHDAWDFVACSGKIAEEVPDRSHEQEELWDVEPQVLSTVANCDGEEVMTKFTLKEIRDHKTCTCSL